MANDRLYDTLDQPQLSVPLFENLAMLYNLCATMLGYVLVYNSFTFLWFVFSTWAFFCLNKISLVHHHSPMYQSNTPLHYHLLNMCFLYHQDTWVHEKHGLGFLMDKMNVKEGIQFLIPYGFHKDKRKHSPSTP